MKLSAYQTELKKIVDQRNGYLLLSTGLLILAFVLALLVVWLCERKQIILITPNMSEMSVSHHHASKDYLTKITIYYAESALNVTPDNVDFQQEILLQQTDPSYYKSLKPILLQEADKIKKEHISTAFFPVDVKVDEQHNEAIVIGDLKSYVGDTALPTKRMTYRFAYRFNGFTPLITAFEEVKSA